MATIDQQSNSEPLPSVLTVAHLVYALHAFAIVVGIAGAATVIVSFVGSLPSIVAVILNYVKRGDARGTWVASHYRWQIRGCGSFKTTSNNSPPPLIVTMTSLRHLSPRSKEMRIL